MKVNFAKVYQKPLMNSHEKTLTFGEFTFLQPATNQRYLYSVAMPPTGMQSIQSSENLLAYLIDAAHPFNLDIFAGADFGLFAIEADQGFGLVMIDL